MDPKKIAVVRLDKIGDLILTTPAIASLKAAFPQSFLTALVSPYNQVVVAHSPHVDKIWPWEGTAQDWRQLREAHFDLVVVFSPTMASYKIAFFSRAKVRAGYVYGNRIFSRLFSSMALNRRLIDSIDRSAPDKKAISIPHEVEQNLQVVKMVTDAPLETNLVVPVPPSDIEWAQNTLNDGSKIGIHLSASWFKALPSDFLLSTLRKISSEGKVFVTIGAQEAAYASAIQWPEEIMRFRNLSFDRWGALIRQANVFITTDTGAMHVAASQKAPVVAVLEPEFFAYHAQRWRPWQVPYRLLRKDDPDLADKIVKAAKELRNSNA